MAETDIGWVDKNMNWLDWHCIEKSEGCRNCYAKAQAKRYGKTFHGIPAWRDSSEKDYRMLKPGDSAFVNTMSDTFIEGLSFDLVMRMFALATQKPGVNFLFLTKRIERALELAPRLPWSTNIWVGTSIENRKRLYRLDVLRQMPTPNLFVSVEPLLEGLGEVDWRGVKGVIVGGESGANRRPFDKAWARTIRDECARDGVGFYFKQGGAYSPGQDRDLDGRTHDDVPWRSGAVPETPVKPKQESLL